MPVQALTHEPLTPAQQAQIDGLTETVANLARRLSEAETQLRVAREDIVLIEDGVSYDIAGLKKEVGELRHAYTPDAFPDEPEAVEEPVVSKTSTREEIIEKAKADVAKLQTENHADNDVWFVDDGYYVSSHEVEFIINRNKRTVVALIREIDGEVDKKGVAKCAPNDCFNVYIGQAISLRRALGLDIPSEYVNAPQPTEVHVGDVVTWEVDFAHYRVISEDSEDNLRGVWCIDGTSNWVASADTFYHALILDDSRDGRYGEVYSV